MHGDAVASLPPSHTLPFTLQANASEAAAPSSSSATARHGTGEPQQPTTDGSGQDGGGERTSISASVAAIRLKATQCRSLAFTTPAEAPAHSTPHEALTTEEAAINKAPVQEGEEGGVGSKRAMGLTATVLAAPTSYSKTRRDTDADAWAKKSHKSPAATGAGEHERRSMTSTASTATSPRAKDQNKGSVVLSSSGSGGGEERRERVWQAADLCCAGLCTARS